MDVSCFQEYPFNLRFRGAVNGFIENNAVEFSNKRRMLKESDESKKKKQTGFRVCSRGNWRTSEDCHLMELVAVYGPQNWNHNAKKMQGRTCKSCRLRWFNQLDPRINKRPFSLEEEERLLAAHRAFGNRWAMLFNGRTDNALREPLACSHGKKLEAAIKFLHQEIQWAHKPTADKKSFNLSPGLCLSSAIHPVSLHYLLPIILSLLLNLLP